MINRAELIANNNSPNLKLGESDLAELDSKSSSSSKVLDELSVNEFYDESNPVRNIVIDSIHNKVESQDVKNAQWHAKVFGFSPDLNQKFFLRKRQ